MRICVVGKKTINGKADLRRFEKDDKAEEGLISTFEISQRIESPDFGGIGSRHDGGSTDDLAFGTVSSGLEIPTIRKTFPITRTTGFIGLTVPLTLRYFK